MLKPLFLLKISAKDYYYFYILVAVFIHHNNLFCIRKYFHFTCALNDVIHHTEGTSTQSFTSKSVTENLKLHLVYLQRQFLLVRAIYFYLYKMKK